MTLTDSGPLAGLLNRQDQHYQACASAAPTLSMPLVTSLACLTEALHFLGRDLGWNAQERLWALVAAGQLEVHSFTAADLDRMHRLMAKYSDVPMDLADASLVVLAEHLNVTRVFTVDSHFRAYRLRDRRAFQVIPDS